VAAFSIDRPSSGAGSFVSIVIIFFNAERFLAEAVDSVLAQTWRDWELLLVDDGSRDASSGLARQYAAGDLDRIRYLEHPDHDNLGRSASRNLGAARARGHWLTFLDSDDVWMPQHLERQIDLLGRHPEAEAAYGPGVWWFTWDPNAHAPDHVQDIGVQPGLLEPPAVAPLFLERSEATPCIGSMIVRRTTFERLGGFEASFKDMYDDQVFHLKAALHSRILVTGEHGLLYRQHEDSCCAESFRRGTHARARLRFLRWAREHVRDTGVNDPRVVFVLKRQLAAARRSYGAAGFVTRVARRVLPARVTSWLRERI